MILDKLKKGLKYGIYFVKSRYRALDEDIYLLMGVVMALSDYIANKPVLRTERLTLRQLLPSDIPALKEWMPDKAMYAYWGKPPGKTDKNPELLFEKIEKNTKSFHWGIALNESDTVIGEAWISGCRAQ